MKKLRYIFGIGIISFLSASTLYAGFLGPLALLSLPSSIESLIKMKELSKLKNELIKLLPHIAVLLIVLAMLLVLVCFILITLNIRRIYRAYKRNRMKIYAELLHSLQLELTLKKDIRSSFFLQKLYEKIQLKSFRKQVGHECSLIIDQALDILLSGAATQHDQERILHSVVLLINSRVFHAL